MPEPSRSRPLPALHAALGLPALALIATLGCGGPPERQPVGPRIGMSSGAEVEAVEAPAEGAIELALRRPDGTFIDVGELRGSVVVLFVFATFDAASQMMLRPLGSLAEAQPDVRVVGVAAQPNARLLVDAYVHALSPPFPITYDPEELVQTGQSTLGRIASVPMLIILDARGVEVARHAGFVQGAALVELVAQAQ